jgi:hypothetical protein
LEVSEVKSTTLIFIATWMLLFQLAGTGSAESPDLEAGVLIEDSSGPIDMDFHFVPAIVDWNEDGAKDLIIGQYTDGHIHLFLNQGSDFKPVFTTSTLLESAGSPITTTFG